MSVLYQEYQFWTLIMSFAYVRRYAPFSLAFHIIVSNNAVSVRYAVLGSPSRNQIYILSLYIETHKVSDTCGISTKKLVLTLLTCGMNKRWHCSKVDCLSTIFWYPPFNSSETPKQKHLQFTGTPGIFLCVRSRSKLVEK